MTIEIDGEYTTAEVKIPKEHVEKSLQEEIQEQVDNKAFQNRIVYMPDCHGGLGPQAIVGFSMPLGNRIIPNSVGGDIGCGMTAVRIDDVDVDFDDIDDLRDINSQTRSNIPMGTGRVNDHDEEFEELYPWSHANNTLKKLHNFLSSEQVGEHDYTEEKFDIEYFEDLCEKVGISEKYAKDSLASLGSGNHFIEISESQDNGSLWIVAHSGSRNLGQQVASFHQEKAIEKRESEVDWEAMSEEQKAYANADGSPNWKQIRQDFNGNEIEELGNEIESFSPNNNRNTDLDYLEGEEMYNYLRDMIFTQEYATHNRKMMAEYLADILGSTIREYINSPHNYVDFEDGIIRKGSTRSGEGEKFVVPMNMEDGTLLCRGKGNPDWHNSAPHGSGRLGSRGWARSEFDADEVRKRMYENGTYSAHVPGDEVPEAYKKTELIEKQIKPTAEVLDRLVPQMNFKA